MCMNFCLTQHPRKDLFMQNNDYLYVAPAEKIVEVKGAVNRPYT